MKTYFRSQLLVDELQLLSNQLNTSMGNLDYKLNSKLIHELRFLRKILDHVGLDHSCSVIDCSSFDRKTYFGVSSLCVGTNNLYVGWPECENKFDFVNEYMKSHMNHGDPAGKSGLLTIELPDGSFVYSLLYENVTFRDFLDFFSSKGNLYLKLYMIEKERLSCAEFAEYEQGDDCKFSVSASFYDDNSCINSVILNFKENGGIYE